MLSAATRDLRRTGYESLVLLIVLLSSPRSNILTNKRVYKTVLSVLFHFYTVFIQYQAHILIDKHISDPALGILTKAISIDYPLSSPL
jgi:hypothetical protein